jgi:tetratricopeptide (TPR) repeat protein
LEQVKIGRSYEPASPLAAGVELFHTMATRRYDQVIAEGRRVTAVFPKLGMAHGLLGDALWRTGKYDEAIAEYELQAGANSEGIRVLETGLQAGRGTAQGLASAYAEAGENDLAMEWLEKAFADRTPQLLHMVADPAFDGLAADLRYKELLRRIGLPLVRSARSL